MTLVRGLYTVNMDGQKFSRVASRLSRNKRTNSDGEGDLPDPSDMSASRKRKLSDGDSKPEPEMEKPTSLFLALDNIPVPTTYAKIETFFLPLRLKAIVMDVDYGVLEAPQVQFYSLTDREQALLEKQGKLLIGQQVFLRSPEDMQATKPGCGWEMVHPILQRELFSHFNIFNRSRLQRVSKTWKHDLENLDPRVKEAVSFPTSEKHDYDNASKVPCLAMGSVRHLVFYKRCKFEQDDIKQRWIESCHDCQKVSFVGGEYSENWIARLTQSVGQIKLWFVNCCIKLSYIGVRSYDFNGSLINTCRVKVRNLCMVGKDDWNVSESDIHRQSDAYSDFYTALQREFPMWNLAAWDNWWTQNKTSIDPGRLQTITPYFDSDTIRKILMPKLPQFVTAERLSKDRPHNLRDCMFLWNLCCVQTVRLPKVLDDMFLNAEYSADVYSRYSIEFTDACVEQYGEYYPDEDDDDDDGDGYGGEDSEENDDEDNDVNDIPDEDDEDDDDVE